MGDHLQVEDANNGPAQPSRHRPSLSDQHGEPRHGDYQLYKSRWYTLFLYCCTNMLASMIPFTFSPVPDYSNYYYGNIGKLFNLKVLLC
jgi:hypothetical protein